MVSESDDQSEGNEEEANNNNQNNNNNEDEFETPVKPNKPFKKSRRSHALLDDQAEGSENESADEDFDGRDFFLSFGGFDGFCF